MLLSISAHADVTILTPDNDHAKNIAVLIKSNLNQKASIVHTIESTDHTDLVIALGEDALKNVIVDSKIPVIGAFLPSSYPKSSEENNYFYIYSDPSPRDLAEFFVRSFPSSTIGYIYTPAELPMLDAISAHLKTSTTKLKMLPYSGSPFKDIRKLEREGIDSFWLSKNREIYKSEKLRFILEALFRKRVPVISTSLSLTKSGATVSITSNSDSVISQIVSTVNGIQADSPPIDQSIYVEDVVVKVNLKMSEYFNINIKEVGNE